MDYLQEKNRLDQLVREGRHKQVRLEIDRLRQEGIPRAIAADIANLARRAGGAELSLKILNPIVRPVAVALEPPTPKEQAIYAASLARIGAVTEALNILIPLQETQVPEVLLYLAFAYIHQWDYENSAKVLRIYLSNKSLTSYERTLAQLNLLAAFRFLNNPLDEKPILDEVIEVCRQNRWALLERNALHVGAQAAILRQEWAEAESHLKSAEDLAIANDLDFFLIRKWKVLLNLHRFGPQDQSIEALSKIRHEAQQAGDFETMRDCDYYKALFLRDRDLYLQVYFGTPFKLYRERMHEKAGSWIELPPSVLRQMSDVPSKTVFHLAEGCEHSEGARSQVQLPLDSVLSKLFRTLVTDWYRPFQIVGIFSSLYPNEILDPYHSADRVKAAIKRLRLWFRDNEIPLQINNHQKDYYLHATVPYALLLNLEYKDESHYSPADHSTALASLKEKWPYKSFSSTQAAKFLGINQETVRELLKSAVEKGRLYRTGDRRSTLFHFGK